MPRSDMHPHESFRTRSLVEHDEGDVDEGSTTIVMNDTRERLQLAASKCIATNRLKSILEGADHHYGAHCYYPDADLSKDAVHKKLVEHRRNAGKWTVVAFVNSASGGGMGKTIFDDLVAHLGEEHVFDLNSCTNGNMPEDNLVNFALDPNVRILACGGDGTVGWIESSIDRVWEKILGTNAAVEDTVYRQHLPLAIMPLGTGNDLSRQFGWGGKFNEKMRGEGMITRVEKAKPAFLDRWRCVVLPLDGLDEEARVWVPRMFGERTREKTNSICKLAELFAHDDERGGLALSGLLPTKESSQFFDGVFCNYFSIGFDANVAFQFHREREEHPKKFTSVLMNKVVYVQKSPAALTSPRLHDKIRVMVTNAEGDIQELKVPKDCRAMVLLNIQSYAGGHKLTNKGQTDDRLLEVVFVSNVVRAATSFALSPVMPFLLFRVAAQTNMVCIRTMRALYCQVDGEPWLQSRGVIRINYHSQNALLRQMKASARCNCASQADTVQT